MLFDCAMLTTPKQGIPFALFLAGFLGSLTHCVGMCSPFVLSQVSSLNGNKVGMERIKGMMLLPYHSGRITTYILLGVIASLLSSQIMAYPAFRTISAILLAAAGIIFLMAAFSHSNIIPFPRLSCGIPRWLSQLIRPLFATPTGLRGYILGIMLGFIPCGLVFAAVMAVTATANPLLAAVAMAAFGVGTMPTLLGISLGSSVFLHKRKHWLQPFSTAMMFANSFILFLMAGGWKI